MTTRFAGLAAIAALVLPASIHAEIAGPPPLGQNPETPAPANPAMQEFAAPPSKPTTLSDKTPFSSIPTPIEFDSLEGDTDIEDDLGLTPDRVGEAASVKSMEIEIQQALEMGDTSLAEKLFDKLMRLGAPTSRKRDAILRMGRQLDEQQKEPAKAIVVYEQFLQQFPNDPESPEILLRLGRIYRETGAHASALNKFYSVLYSSLQVKTGEDYNNASLRAKMEIAHTHFAAGEYKEAAQLYSRVKLVKMPPEEASEVAFRLAYISFLAGDHAEALTKADAFLDTYPASPLAPEAQYLKIQSLKKLGRNNEAMKETIELLQAGREFGKKRPAVWAYWQRKTGNEIANELYESGDAFGALTVYQKLAALNDAPDWRGPTIYQIGLCYERLRHLDRAREAYKYIIDKIPATNASQTDAVVGENLATIRDLAEWRLEHLDWLEKSEKNLFPLINKPVPPPQQPAAAQGATTPSPTQQAANQIAPTPATVR
jgi:outer membrane protein assembly factor BamD (BamD/ComL family)